MLAYRWACVLIRWGHPGAFSFPAAAPPLPTQWGEGWGEGRFFYMPDTKLRSSRVPARAGVSRDHAHTLLIVIPAKAGIQASVNFGVG